MQSKPSQMVEQIGGIQQLRATEKRAADRVAEAMKRKAIRLKEAREDAQNEIEEYREKKEKQFKVFDKNLKAHCKDVCLRIDDDTQHKISQMDKAVSVNKNAVVKTVLELVYDIQPKVHQNFKVTASNKE